ncbi:MAG: hypothetical protein AAB846_01610 [Patescibacteria group bacterium]
MRKQPESEMPQAQHEKKAIDTTALAIASADTDKDGLKDWEETLWKTDPKSPDTDGDGAPDGEEVRAGRNPSVKGPNDVHDGAPPQIGNAAGKESGEGNLTDAFTQALSNTIGPRVAQGVPLSADDISGIKKYLPDKNKILGQVPEITSADLVIAGENDPASVKKYFASVYAVYEKTVVPLKEDDLQILMEYLRQNKPEELNKIDNILHQLDLSIAGIKKIPVPAGYENYTVKEVNYAAKTKRAVEIIRHADTDPISAMAVLEFRYDLLTEIRAFHQNYGKELQTKIAIESGDTWKRMFWINLN